MAVDTKHLRHISVNYYGTVLGGNVAVGAVVPAGTRRFIYYIRIYHDSANAQLISLFRDGAAGAVPFDYMFLPGSGGGALADVGKTWLQICLDITSPTHILDPAEQLGLGAPALVTAGMLVTAYDEP